MIEISAHPNGLHMDAQAEELQPTPVEPWAESRDPHIYKTVSSFGQVWVHSLHYIWYTVHFGSSQKWDSGVSVLLIFAVCAVDDFTAYRRCACRHVHGC